MTSEYIVRRWRAYVAPSDVTTLALLLATGATFPDRKTPILPQSPAASEVYTERVHITAGTWPYPRPDNDRLALLDTEPIAGGMLDVFRIVDRDSGVAGQFVSLMVGGAADTAVLVTGPPGWFCNRYALALYSPHGAKPARENKAGALMLSALGYLFPEPADCEAITWNSLTNPCEVSVVAAPAPIIPHRFQPTHSFDDDVWNLKPQAPGTDLMFDQVMCDVLYTRFMLRAL